MEMKLGLRKKVFKDKNEKKTFEICETNLV